MKPPPFAGGCHPRSALLGIEGEEEIDSFGRLGWLDRIPPIWLLEIGLYPVRGENIDGQILVAVRPPQRNSSVHRRSRKRQWQGRAGFQKLPHKPPGPRPPISRD